VRFVPLVSGLPRPSAGVGARSPDDFAHEDFTIE
jgi:hypothetical protein